MRTLGLGLGLLMLGACGHCEESLPTEKMSDAGMSSSSSDAPFDCEFKWENAVECHRFWEEYGPRAQYCDSIGVDRNCSGL